MGLRIRSYNLVYKGEGGEVKGEHPATMVEGSGHSGKGCGIERL